MAETYPIQDEPEQTPQTTPHDTMRPTVVASITPVGIDEQPERSSRGSVVAGAILLLLVLLLLAYFVFQWWI
jgi:hypothetical protein